MKTHSRRRFLELAGAGTAVALAGCSGTGTDSETTPTDAETGTDSTATTETDTETTTTETTTMSTVFHFSSGEEHQKHATANAKNLLDDGTTDVERVALVANGVGIKLLTTDSTVPEKVRSLAENGVAFEACANSMEAFDYSNDDLLEGVETVPAGVGELTKLQSQGYAYVKTP
ncbi:hypothetical protein DMJ13_01685 [halophilic archaeon]|nr:hypothetical protein DMJ13_01685 [halophilic archaeon]